ncbi:MAG: arginine--tRNA ligase [Candidatus Levyibacteriota bacterium]
MDLEAKILLAVQKAAQQFSGSEVSVHLTHPTDATYGDYTTNVAFQLAKEVGKSPLEVAEILVKNLTNSLENVEKIEAVKPGFINLFVSKDYLIGQINEILQNPQTVGETSFYKGKRIVVEFTDPNPFKEFHIGHLYTNTVGESLSRILEANGAIVWRADYFGDVGMHVAKAIYGLKQKLEEDKIAFTDLETKSLPERIQYLGKAYAKGATAFEKDKEAVEKMKEINKLAFMASQRMWKEKENLATEIDYAKGQLIDETLFVEVYQMYTVGRQWSIDYFEDLYQRLGMHFDGYYPESIAGEKGYALVKSHMKDGVFEEDAGAIVFRGEKSGLHTRVFINSLGFPTYEAKELGLAPWKYEDFKYDKSIIVTGNEIKEYFKVLIAAMLAIEPELGKKTMHLPHGMVRLPEGKMSSRTGKIITGEWLLNEAVQKAINLSQHTLDKFEEEQVVMTTSSKKSMGALSHGMKASELQETSEQVGIGAVKYAFLKTGIGKDLEFDFETSLSLNGNSGPYLQYSYVRTQSILQKAGKQKLQDILSSDYTPGNEEMMLARLVMQFSGVVKQAAETLAPSTICTYLYELAKGFNLFYQTNRIVDASTQDEKAFRLALTEATGLVLAKGLSLLGIAAPKRM